MAWCQLFHLLLWQLDVQNAELSVFIHPSWIIPIPFSMRWCYKICICQCYLPVRVKMANSVIPGVFSATREIPISKRDRRTDGQMDRRTDGQTDSTKSICLPWKGGDIIGLEKAPHMQVLNSILHLHK